MSTSVQTAHALGLALYSYANDNDGNYPDGKSSTEAFQKLIDGGYVTDASIFYLPLPGKVKAEPHAKLKPENVAWDLTTGVDRDSSDDVPLLFVTGYRVNYQPGSAAIARKGYSSFFGLFRDEAFPPYAEKPGIAVFSKNNNAKFLPEGPDGTNGAIPHFVPLTFKSNGQTYRQLTPDGALGP